MAEIVSYQKRQFFRSELRFYYTNLRIYGT